MTGFVRSAGACGFRDVSGVAEERALHVRDARLHRLGNREPGEIFKLNGDMMEQWLTHLLAKYGKDQCEVGCG